MIRAFFILLALFAVFAFPWPYTFMLAFVAALLMPEAGVALGLIADALYYTHGIGMPWATIAGSSGAAVAYGIRRFARSRVALFSTAP